MCGLSVFFIVFISRVFTKGRMAANREEMRPLLSRESLLLCAQLASSSTPALLLFLEQ